MNNSGMARDVIILSLITMTNSISIDTYIPALQQIKSTFHVNDMELRLFLSSYLMGSMLSIPFLGCLVNRYGYKKIIITAMTVYTVCNILSFCVVNYSFILMSRLIEGLFSGGFIMLAHSIIRENFNTSKSISVLSATIAIFSLSPIFSSSVGSLITTVSSWRFIYIFIAVFESVTVLIVVKWLPAHFVNSFPTWSETFVSYKMIMRDKVVCAQSLILALVSMGYAVYISSANVIMRTFNMTDDFSYLIFLSLVSGVILGAVFSHLRSASNNIITIYCGFVVMFLSVMGSLYISMVENKPLFLYLMQISLYSCGLTIVTPVFISGIIGLYVQHKSLVSSVQFIFQSLSMVLTISIISPTVCTTLFGVSMSILVSLAVSTLLLRVNETVRRCLSNDEGQK